MKKVISVKEIILILMGIMLIMISTSTFALEPTVIPSNEYDNAQAPDVDNNAVGNNAVANNTIGNNVKNNVTNNKVNNTNNTNNKADLPQTGIEDYNIGILLIICIASAIFAYRKINDYRNV